jgi:hypothetical protein
MSFLLTDENRIEEIVSENNEDIQVSNMFVCSFCFHFYCFWWGISAQHHIDDIMVSVLASSAVERGLKHRSRQTKDYKIGICCFSVKKAALRR